MAVTSMVVSTKFLSPASILTFEPSFSLASGQKARLSTADQRERKASTPLDFIAFSFQV